MIYNDEGVSLRSTLSVHHSLTQRYPDYNISYINSSEITAGILTIADCLVIPGGADLPYCQQLNGSGNQHIQQFVKHGGMYVGICAGAYYACSAINFRGHNYSISGSRELGLCSGTAVGCLGHLTNGHLFNDDTASKNIIETHMENGLKIPLYYHGGPHFTGIKDERIIATYPTGEIAIISGEYGNGYYLLSGLHFELCPGVYQQHYQQEKVLLSMTEQSIEERIIKVLEKNTYGQYIFEEWEQLLHRKKST